jgi:aerobic-type carbon monoxide dehydrogenase small subunit (CoxS/CutS family)
MREVESAPDTPLLYVLTDEMHLQGPRFGCGLAQCGSCSVLLDGKEIRSCVTPVSAVNGKSVTTLEGLPQWYAEQRKLAKAPDLHPIQQAVIDEQAVQCGYCYNGMMIQAADLLSKNSRPSERQIREAMNGHLCRCGSYPRMMQAIRRASEMMHGAHVAEQPAEANGSELAENFAAGDAEVAR